MGNELREEVVHRLSLTRKYRFTCRELIERVADWALVRHPTVDKAVKAAKRKLHQITAAYIDPKQLKRAERLVEAAVEGLPPEERCALCREVLACHVSTAERLDLLDDIFDDVFGITGRPRTILDLAAGLNPFALPWMNLDPDASYFAYDVDHRLVDLTNRYLRLEHRRPLAACHDALSASPLPRADLVLLLKCLPCFERQEKGACARLLRRIRAPHAVMSFPTRSIGGRSKAMAKNYDDFARGLAADLDVPLNHFSYSTETIYILRLDQ